MVSYSFYIFERRKLIMGYFHSFYICETGDEAKKQCSPWGNSYFTISREDIEALLSGKILAGCVACEYGIFIAMDKEAHE